LALDAELVLKRNYEWTEKRESRLKQRNLALILFLMSACVKGNRKPFLVQMERRPLLCRPGASPQPQNDQERHTDAASQIFQERFGPQFIRLNVVSGHVIAGPGHMNLRNAGAVWLTREPSRRRLRERFLLETEYNALTCPFLSRLNTSLMDSSGKVSIVAFTLPSPANASDSSRSKRVPTMEPRIV